MIETAIWWTGACVLGSGAALGAAMIIAAVTFTAFYLAGYCCVRLWGLPSNLYWMLEWRRNGCPRFVYDAERGSVVMKPTKGADA